MKTPISYYGGKQAIISHILPLIPYHEIYTEVFFGGGTVFFSKAAAKNETINDRLDIVINFYRVLKTNFIGLKKMIDASLISRSTYGYALAISKGHIPADEITRAWAFWFVINFSFLNKLGGGYKHPNDMSISVPQTLRNKKYQFTEALVSRIENAYIENEDYLKVLDSRNHHKAFHYIDPPYFNADQGHYKGWTESDQAQLLNWMAGECKGKFLFSNYNSPQLDEFIRVHGWNKKEITLRLKAHKIKNKDKIEVLVYNYEPVKTLFTDTNQ